MLCIKEVKTERVDGEKLRHELARHEAIARTDPRVIGGTLTARDPIRMTMSAKTLADLGRDYHALMRIQDVQSFYGYPIDINDNLPFGEIVITERVG